MTDANLMDADCIHGNPWYECDECWDWYCTDECDHEASVYQCEQIDGSDD